MSILHICNTFFDLELSKQPFPPLEQAFNLHEVFLQLQFLPFLYASTEEEVLVSFAPEDHFWKRLHSPPKLRLVEETSFSSDLSIEVWGHSPTILEWAKKRGLTYQMPPWPVVQQVNSKAFSFEACPLPGGQLIHNESELKQWLRTLRGEAVLKTCFGTAGRGHLLFKEINDPKLKIFAEQEWQQGRAVIGEPWMRRVLDFSTQWEISNTKEIRKIGSTLCHNDPKGRYRQNSVGDTKTLFGVHVEKVEEQERFVQKVLSKIALLGYFGNVGIDAMIYENERGALQLHPIVEINARKTMGWAALAIQKKHFPGKNVRLAFTKNKEAGILPLFAKQKVPFSRYIEITII
ncbi:MAG TPA: hypothetical protein VLF61_03245 [Rhabdochlamydiaceae bacterium]|nr:hypothetical protein [Rhabdochlamydiaceae bacterium]